VPGSGRISLLRANLLVSRKRLMRPEGGLEDFGRLRRGAQAELPVKAGFIPCVTRHYYRNAKNGLFRGVLGVKGEKIRQVGVGRLYRPL